ncbi:MAG: hypothetical protein AB7L76_15115 [Burkholderiaceae bacterium]
MDGLRQVASAAKLDGEAAVQRHPALSRFCDDARAILSQGYEREQLSQVKSLLQKLLADTGFIAQYCGPDAKPGLHLLHEDGELGFQVLAHINDKPKVSPPHNHGASWAIYGQAVGHTDMTDWERVVEGQSPALARMVAVRKYRLQPCDAGLFSHGAIHSIDFPAQTRFVRVTGTNLDLIQRTAFDPLTGGERTLGPAPAGAAGGAGATGGAGAA